MLAADLFERFLHKLSKNFKAPRIRLTYDEHSNYNTTRVSREQDSFPHATNVCLMLLSPDSRRLQCWETSAGCWMLGTNACKLLGSHFFSTQQVRMHDGAFSLSALLDTGQNHTIMFIFIISNICCFHRRKESVGHVSGRNLFTTTCRALPPSVGSCARKNLGN